MTSRRLFRRRDLSKESLEGEKSDDSKSLNSEDGRKGKTAMKSALSTMRRSGSDSIEIVKKGIGIQTQDLCETCKKIPFMACLTDDKGITREDGEAAADDRVPDALLHFNSLSDILVNRAFCKTRIRSFESSSYQGPPTRQRHKDLLGLGQEESLLETRTGRGRRLLALWLRYRPTGSCQIDRKASEEAFRCCRRSGHQNDKS